MDLNEFRSFISDSGVDVWTWIDMSISLASADHQIELRNRRDQIIQRLYQPPFSRCEICVRNKENFGCNSKEMGFDEKNASFVEDDDDEDDEQRKIQDIKNLLDDDHSQDEKSLIELLKRLLGMNTTFKTLKETEIGRHVTKLRKHSSNEVRMLVKVIVRKWKDTVDELVRHNTPIEEEITEFNGDRKLDDARNHKTPPKRKAEENGIEFNDEDHQESPNAKKQRTQVVDISKMKNSMVPINGGSVSIKYW